MYAYDSLIEQQNTFAPYEQNQFDIDPYKSEGPVDWLTDQGGVYPAETQIQVETIQPVKLDPAVTVENIDNGTQATFAPEPEKKNNLLLIGGGLLLLYFIIK